jgi:hypothetical protein
MSMCQDCKSLDCTKAEKLKHLREVLRDDLNKFTEAASLRDKQARENLYDAQDACHRRQLVRTP